jgi:hypothetical protein
MAQEPVVDTKAVDQFFDIPASDNSEFEPGLAVDTSTTQYFNQPFTAKPTDPVPDDEPTPDPSTPPPSEPDAPPAPAPPPPDIDYISENLSLKQQIAELQLYKPLGDMIQRNPNFLSAVEQSLKTMPGVPPEPPKIERPVAPVKPTAYDVTEAMSAPGSESWKYREAQEAFTGEMFSYYEKRDAQREEIQTRAVQSYQEKQAAMDAHRQLTSELSTRYGYTPDRVEDFIKTMSDPASRSIENLVALHSMQLQKRSATPQVQKTAQKNVPLPAGITGGGGSGQTKQLSESDSFNLGLLSARR